MSESIVKVAGCGAPSEPEQIRCNAAIIALQHENESIHKQIKSIGETTPFATSMKSITYATLFIAFVSLLLAVLALAKIEIMLDVVSILQRQ